MNEEYIKKLEVDNKRLEETLAKYIDRYGELKPVNPIVEFPTNPSDTVTFGQLSGLSIAQVSPANAFVAQSPNGNVLTVNSDGIFVKSNNFTIDAQSIVSTVESDAVKEIKEIKKIIENNFRKPKPIFKRYCRVALKKLKRKFK